MSPEQGGAGPVFVHVGEPKTGTTFLQQVMWSNKTELEAHGVHVPGPRPMAHWRAAQDLGEVAQIPNDPAGPHKGAWDKLARQAVRATGLSVISHELLSAVSTEQAERAIRSLRPADVHVVLTVRDFSSLLPAEWQETVKHRNTRSWEDWLSDVIDRESVAADRRGYWFWRVHDTLEILRIWAAQLPPDKVHVITTPPRGSAPDLLWHRFAGLLGIDPAVADTARARSNASLGLAEVELLRRINAALPDAMPGWFYMRNVKDALAHKALAARPNPFGRLELPPERDKWAHTHAETLIAKLRAAPYDVVGDLDELRPAPSGPHAATPSDATAEQMLDAAVVAITALLGELGKTQGVALSSDEGPASGATEARVGLVQPVKQWVIQLSQRSTTVFKLRRSYWHLANAARQLRSAARPHPPAGGE